MSLMSFLCICSQQCQDLLAVLNACIITRICDQSSQFGDKTGFVLFFISEDILIRNCFRHLFFGQLNISGSLLLVRNKI